MCRLKDICIQTFQHKHTHAHTSSVGSAAVISARPRLACVLRHCSCRLSFEFASRRDALCGNAAIYPEPATQPTVRCRRAAAPADPNPIHTQPEPIQLSRQRNY
ncbi:unnamed protein product [Ceratitis capitata]|uniref:(Mediterranean fruit fly) hypothetical protein n=1 Tax=Ceratitis capitata TaxID=7213 RepID=A0A811V2X4_CERCA|nr:unnamed protein product [Ceratitis capitata]